MYDTKKCVMEFPPSCSPRVKMLQGILIKQCKYCCFVLLFTHISYLFISSDHSIFFILVKSHQTENLIPDFFPFFFSFDDIFFTFFSFSQIFTLAYISFMASCKSCTQSPVYSVVLFLFYQIFYLIEHCFSVGVFLFPT